VEPELLQQGRNVTGVNFACLPSRQDDHLHRPILPVGVGDPTRSRLGRSRTT
jgi:hypothetical protein